MAFGEILKKVTAALKQSQTSADARFQPKSVGKGRAVPTAPGKIEKPEKGFEEFSTDN